MTANIFHPFFVLIFFIPSLSLFGQGGSNEEKEKPINHYKNEIALDFQNAFRNLINGFSDDNFNNTAIATSLIFRRRIGEKKFVSLNEKKVLRIQLGGSFNSPLSSKEIYDSTLTGNANLFDIKESRADVFSYIGIEWQRQFGKFQLYYGLDTGIRYYNSRDIATVIVSPTTNQINYWREVNYRLITIPLSGLAGVKYYFHPRFSLSYEMSLGIAVGFKNNRQDRFEPGIEGPAEREFYYKRTELSGFSDYLRYFNISYYF